MSSSGMGIPNAHRRIHPTFPACSSFARFNEFISMPPVAALLAVGTPNDRSVWYVAVQLTKSDSIEGNTSRKCSLFSVLG